MAGPITWRNVNGDRSAADAAIMFRGATQQINTGLDAFGDILKRAEATQASNVKAEEEVGKANFLDTLQSARTPEELAALQASGQLDAARASLGAAARNATRGAEEARTTTLRSNEAANVAFTNQRLDEAEKPLRDELATMALTDPIGARARALELQNSGQLRSVAPILKDAQANERDNTRYAQSQTAYAQSQESYNHGLKMRPIQDRVAERADVEGGLRAAQSAREEKDRALVEKTVAPRLQAFEQTKTAFNDGVKEIGTRLGLPVESGTGLPDTDKMTPQQLSAFGKELQAKKLDRAATSSEYLDQMRKEMIANGASVAAVNAALKQAEPVIKGDTPLSGEDQALMDSRVASIDAQLANVKANNLFYNPPKETAQLKANVLSSIDKLVQDGPDTRRSIRMEVSKWMDEGIAIRDANGKRIMVPVPPNVAAAALAAGADQNSYLWNSTTGEMRTELQRILTSPEYAQQRAEAVPFNTGQYLVDQRNIKRDFKRLNGTVTPSDYLVSFDKRLAAEVEKAKERSTAK